MTSVLPKELGQPDALLSTTDRSFITSHWVIAGALGGLVASLGWRSLLLVAAVGLVMSVALLLAIVRRPVLAARTMVVAGPLLVGLERGSLAGPLRANELLLGLVGLGVAGALIVGTVRLPRCHRCDTAIAGLFTAGIVVPLLLAYARGRGPSIDDVLSAFTLAKGVALYAVVRLVHDSADAVWRTARLSIMVAASIAVLSVFDALNVGGVSDLLARVWPSTVGPVIDDGRASATIGNPIGLGGYLVMHLALAIPLVRSKGSPAPIHVAYAGSLLIGVLATGQISAWIALAAVIAVSIAIDPPAVSPRTTATALGVVFLIVAMLWPVAARRADGFSEQAIPSWKLDDIATLEPHRQTQELYYAAPGSSWDVRLYNLETYFLPDLRQPSNVLLGVRPEGRVVPREPWLDFVWIESGVLWLVYVGGLPLLGAFLFLLWRFFSQARVNLARKAVRPFAQGALGVLPALALLMLFDPHLTLRGTSEALYPILALCVVAFGQFGTSRPAKPSRVKERS